MIDLIDFRDYVEANSGKISSGTYLSNYLAFKSLGTQMSLKEYGR